ncbi:MAG TPA: antibiotic biosynthesis monooxygenase [Acetobacteraceae bacterium]|jgi:heme-degrading monooxygenase HmoA|nr:antibiotic biosynthesis monooxygenase [Acetobacteraceae bacterium]
MIVRSWSGHTTPDREADYPVHFHHNVLPALRGIDGFLGATLLRELIDGAVVYQVLTRWRDMEDIRGFAGHHPSRAVVEPEAVAALVGFDKTVRHYVVVEEVQY